MSEAGHTTLMALTSGVLEAVTRASLAIRLALQCVGCGAVWTAEARDQGNRSVSCTLLSRMEVTRDKRYNNDILLIDLNFQGVQVRKQHDPGEN